jgi:NMT1/THI5 like
MTSKLFLVAISLTLLTLAGCNKKSGPTVQNSNKVRVGYIGITCEAPIYAAYEKGFFKEEGLEPELVKCNWSTYKDTLALGGYDITHHLVMYFLKPIEQGLDVRFLAGIHRGCLRVQAGVKTNIHTIEDLKGKRIGVPGMGTPPFVFANRVFGVHGIDAGKDITWKVYPAGELGLAIDKGEVDAVANAEPIGSLLIAEDKVRNIAGQSNACPVKRRQMGRDQSKGCRRYGGREKIPRFHARTEHRRARALALRTQCTIGRGVRTYCRPRNESRQDAFSRDRHRSAGETRFHASSRRYGRLD